MMCYYLNVHFQGERVKCRILIKSLKAYLRKITNFFIPKSRNCNCKQIPHNSTTLNLNLVFPLSRKVVFSELWQYSSSAAIWSVRQKKKFILSSNIIPGGPRWHSDYGAVLQIGRSLARSQMVSLEFFIDIILPIVLWPWGRLSL